MAFQLLAKPQTQTYKVDLRKLTEYPLTPVPYSIGLHGFLAKNDKSKALLHIVKDIDDSDLSVNPRDCMIIEDRNPVSQSTGNSTSFGDIAHKILSSTVGHASPVIFSTDMYSENSVKSVERIRRGCGEMLIVSGEKKLKGRRTENHF